MSADKDEDFLAKMPPSIKQAVEQIVSEVHQDPITRDLSKKIADDITRDLKRTLSLIDNPISQMIILVEGMRTATAAVAINLTHLGATEAQIMKTLNTHLEATVQAVIRAQKAKS